MKKIWMSFVLVGVVANTADAHQAVKAAVSLGAKSGAHSIERVSVNRILDALNEAYDLFKIGTAIDEAVQAPVIGGPGVPGLSVSMRISKKGATSIKKTAYFDLRGIDRPTRQQIKHLIESEREWIEDGQGFARLHSSNNEIISIEGRDVDAIAVEIISTKSNREYLIKLSELVEKVRRLSLRGSSGSVLSRQNISNTAR